jgi:magnesium chelatase family protein
VTVILPAARLAAARETTRIPRGGGLTSGHTAVVTTRPCRAPYHIIADVGMVGYGQLLIPGEVPLTPHGFLWLDERPTCARHVLEVLRQPLGDGLLYQPLRAHLRRRGTGLAGSAERGHCA